MISRQEFRLWRWRNELIQNLLRCSFPALYVFLVINWTRQSVGVPKPVFFTWEAALPNRLFASGVCWHSCSLESFWSPTDLKWLIISLSTAFDFSLELMWANMVSWEVGNGRMRSMNKGVEGFIFLIGRFQNTVKAIVKREQVRAKFIMKKENSVVNLARKLWRQAGAIYGEYPQ